MGDWVAVTDTVAETEPDTAEPEGVQLAVYPEMEKPAGAEGAVKEMLTCPLPVVTERLLGAPGTVAVSADTSENAFTSKKATKNDLKYITLEWRAIFIGLSFWLSHKKYE